ncbi:MAG: adenosylmethionine--8-amino-7-oxononanoate transaminase [Desulfobacterales bacterium]|nr:adenosylmethionine--8-amino-7-oxononanoate transaminase [Desulfobacterales bacterium]
MSLSSLWMPFTQMKDMANPPKVVSAKGVIIELDNGKKLIDCISSWWVTLHGHGQPEIAEAIYNQAKKLEHVIFAGFTHDPAEKLADRITSTLPGKLNKLFYSDDGSTSVEVALKMAFQYWKNKNIEKRTRFLSFEGSYHGDTIGAMSVGSRSIFNEIFRDLLFKVDFIPYPSIYLDDPNIKEKEEKALEVLMNYLSQRGDEYAALIIEPLVQGAGGMRMCSSNFLQSLEKIIRQHDILIIYDEIMTGFGRTGDIFACIKAGTFPDIICLSKGITGGFMPLAATICTDKVFEAFLSDDPKKTFYHGHSYTANPIGCAAAIASLELLEKNYNQFKNMENIHLKNLDNFKNNKRVNNLRVCGTIAAMDVNCVGKTEYLNKVGPYLKKKFIEEGFLIRPLGNVIYLIPPYCITENELNSIYSCIQKTISFI